MIFNKIYQKVEHFLTHKSKTKNKENNWELLPKINEDDFNLIYYETSNFSISFDYIKDFYEKDFKHKNHIYKKYNLQLYIEPLCLQLNRRLNDIIDSESFFRFLYHSNYYLTPQEATQLAIKRLIESCFDYIVNLNNDIIHIIEDNEFYKRFNPFNDFSLFTYFLTEEIVRRMKISDSFCCNLHYNLNDLNSILNEYLMRFSIQARRALFDFDDNRKVILDEILRLKLIQKEFKEFDFLNNYINELNEIIEDLDKNGINNIFTKTTINNHLTKTINNNHFNKTTNNNHFNKIEIRYKKTSNNQTDIIPKDKKNKLSDEQRNKITKYLKIWFNTGNLKDEQFNSDINFLLNLNFAEIKNELILKKNVKSFSLFFYFLLQKGIYNRKDIDSIFESKKIKSGKDSLLDKETLSKHFSNFGNGNGIEKDKEIENIKKFFQSF